MIKIANNHVKLLLRIANMVSYIISFMIGLNRTSMFKVQWKFVTVNTNHSWPRSQETTTVYIRYSKLTNLTKVKPINVGQENFGISRQEWNLIHSETRMANTELRINMARISGGVHSKNAIEIYIFLNGQYYLNWYGIL